MELCKATPIGIDGFWPTMCRKVLYSSCSFTTFYMNRLGGIILMFWGGCHQEADDTQFYFSLHQMLGKQKFLSGAGVRNCTRANKIWQNKVILVWRLQCRYWISNLFSNGIGFLLMEQVWNSDINLDASLILDAQGLAANRLFAGVGF